jgi:DNA polymerase-4
VIVGGLPGDRRSVVSTASYEARRFGVHSALPLVQAVRLCPNGVYLRGDMRHYREVSEEVMACFAEFSPDVQQLSIDEAFIDITGTERLFGPPDELARKIKARVKEKTALTVSCGVAENKYVAKIASGMSKPDGLTCIPFGEAEAFMLNLPVDKIWGAGKVAQEKFRRWGYKTCADLRAVALPELKRKFGDSFGGFLYLAARGQAAHTFSDEPASRSMSAERTFDYDLYDAFAAESVLLEICETVMFRALRHNLASRTAFIKIRYGDFSTFTAQETHSAPARTVNEFYARVLKLFNEKYEKGRGIRLLGAGLQNLEERAEAAAQDLFTEEKPARTAKEEKLEETIMAINRKFPKAAIHRGRV